MHIEIAILEQMEHDYETLRFLLFKWQNDTPHTVSVSWFQSAQDILATSDLNVFDILFSGIRMDDDFRHTGIETCGRIRQLGYTGEIVFLTAFSEFVFEGYGVYAFNYLLKPISEPVLQNCMEKYLLLNKKNCYHLKRGDTVTRISYGDIICINKDVNDVVIQTPSCLFYERTTLSQMEKALPAQFLRCHKSSIVNLIHITSIRGRQLCLSNNLIQPVGRKYLPHMRQALCNPEKNNPVHPS